MKVLFWAAAGALVLISPAAAQPQGAGQTAPVLSANCSGFPAPPNLPDGAGASRNAMIRGAHAYAAWQAAITAKKAACRNDISALQAQVDALVEAWNHADRQFVDTTAAWGEEIAEFNGRRGAGAIRPPN
ncbi:MAG: hypothetical protein ABL883_10715 [Terricaulis sp.]